MEIVLVSAFGRLEVLIIRHNGRDGSAPAHGHRGV
jgi:hypothetical protein